MTRSCATSRAVGNWIATAPVVVVLACATASSPSAAPERVTVAPGMAYSGEWNTPLPPGVSSRPDSFRTQLMVSPGVEHIRTRAGTCPACTVEVRIRGIDTTRTFGPGTPPATGQAVAVIQNLDSRITEAYYGFRPSSYADYYFWVDKRPDADSSRITVLEVPRGAGLAVRAGRQKNLEYCHIYPPGHGHSRPDADFLEYKADCTVSANSAQSRILVASLLSSSSATGLVLWGATALRAAMTISQGGWIECNSGCCK